MSVGSAIWWTILYAVYSLFSLRQSLRMWGLETRNAQYTRPWKTFLRVGLCSFSYPSQLYQNRSHWCLWATTNDWPLNLHIPDASSYALGNLKAEGSLLQQSRCFALAGQRLPARTSLYTCRLFRHPICRWGLLRSWTGVWDDCRYMLITFCFLVSWRGGVGGKCRYGWLEWRLGLGGVVGIRWRCLSRPWWSCCRSLGLFWSLCKEIPWCYTRLVACSRTEFFPADWPKSSQDCSRSMLVLPK